MSQLNPIIASFQPLGLEELNAKAALLERTDSKYVLNQAQLERLLQFAQPNFEVLCINGLTEFAYRSVYFDSATLATFKHHNQGRRNRIKVRRRIYMDGGGEYFEVKLKGVRNKTHKYRIRLTPQQAENPQLSQQEWVFLQQKHRKHYQRAWPEELSHSITVDYKRTTLVAKEGGERLTIDALLELFDSQQHHAMPQDRFVLEVKWLFAFEGVEKI